MNLNNLNEIKELYDMGAISYEEYENLKYKILGIVNPKETEKRRLEQEEAQRIAEQKKRDELQEKENQLRKVEMEQKLQAERLVEERARNEKIAKELKDERIRQEEILEQIKEIESKASKDNPDSCEDNCDINSDEVDLGADNKAKSNFGSAIIATILFTIAIVLIGFCLIVAFTVEGAFDGPASVFLFVIILALGITALVGGVKIFKHL